MSGRGKGSNPGKNRGSRGGGSGGNRSGRPPATRRSGTPGRAPDKRNRGRSGRAGANRDGAGRNGERAEHAAKPDKSGIGGGRVEGRNAVRELLVAGRRRVHEVVVSTDRRNAPILDDIAELAQQLSVPIRELGRAKLDAAARTDSHQGVFASAAALPETDIDDLLGEPGAFLLAADGVTDPGNLGALLRTAECAGVTGIVLPRHRAVHVTPAVTKAAAGAVEHLRFAVVGGLPAALAQARDRGVLTIGLDMAGDCSVHELPPVDRAVLLTVGSEGQGLRRLTRQRCEVVASVPMFGATESLNVSVAGALAMYEVVRRRSAD